MNLHDLLTIGIGDKDALSVVRWVIAIFCFSAFIVLFKVIARNYPTIRSRMAVIFLRIGFFLNGCYYLLASAGQVKPAQGAIAVTTATLMPFTAVILIAIGVCFIVLDSVHRVDRKSEAPKVSSQQQLQEATG
jgi:uncharacterized membrane protein YesL